MRLYLIMRQRQPSAKVPGDQFACPGSGPEFQYEGWDDGVSWFKSFNARGFSVKYVSCFLFAALGLGIWRTASAQERDYPREREEYFYQQRRLPYNRIPLRARLNALEGLRRMDLAAAARKQAVRAAGFEGLWQLAGPQPTTTPSDPSYYTAGRVAALAVDPRDPNTVYAGPAGGGVWKTTDGGQHWTPLTDDQPSLAVGALALDPSNPDTVYAGTGEENFAIDSYFGAGILKSTNGGATWTNIVGPFLRASIGALAVHPSDGGILLAATDINGVYRSMDAGQTWTPVLPGAVATSVFFDPTNGDIAYAALGDPDGNAKNGVYRSTDAGETWTSVRGSGVDSLPSKHVGRIAVAIAPSTPTTLYAAISDSSDAMYGSLVGVYKSTDSGAHWARLDGLAGNCNGQCWYNLVLSVHPKDSNVVYFGDLGLARTMDGGVTWQRLPFTGPNGVQVHVDQHSFVYSADSSVFYIGNDGGVWNTTGPLDAQVSWTNLNQTFAVTEFYPGYSIHPTNLKIGLGGTQDNGTQRYLASLTWNTVTCGDGGWTAIDPSLPDFAYAACQFVDIRRTYSLTQNGAWFESSNGIDSGDRQRFIAAFVIDPVNPQRLYFGTQRLYQTNDGAGLWQAISPDLTGGGSATIAAIGVGTSNANVVYAGTTDGKVQMTTNAGAGPGATWTDRSAGLPNRVVTQVRVDPIDAGTVYVTYSGYSTASEAKPGHVYKSTSGGSSWTDISGNLPDIPVNDIVVDPDLPDTYYIATDGGVEATTDGGATWTTLGSGLPRVVVTALALDRPSRTLRAATHGRSVWDFTLPPVSNQQPPRITSITPGSSNAGGGGFTLNIAGSGFSPGTRAFWNGSDRQVHFVDDKNLQVDIAAGDVAGVGRAAVTVFVPSRGGGLSNAQNFPIGPAPSVDFGGIVDAAIPSTGNTVAPGSVVSLFGHNLAPATIVAAAPPLPTTLGGAWVAVNSIISPLYFVSQTQVNFQVPWSTPANTSVTIRTAQGTFASAPQSVRTARFAPALFALNQQGTGQGAIRIANSATVAAPVGTLEDARPARRGEYIEVYSTGLGPVTNTPDTGSPASASPLSRTTTDPAVTIGNLAANVVFSGLAPGSVGLYQVDVQIPNDVTPGDAVPVVLTIGGATSNTVTVAVQ